MTVLAQFDSCFAPLALAVPLLSILVRSRVDVSSGQGSRGADGASNDSLTCQDDVLSTTLATLKKK